MRTVTKLLASAAVVAGPAQAAPAVVQAPVPAAQYEYVES